MRFRKCISVMFGSNYGLVCVCFLNRGERFSMGHFKEIEIGFINIFPPIPGVANKLLPTTSFIVKYFLMVLEDFCK